MIITFDKKYIKAPFVNESEIENVVINNYEYIFGPSSIYLPKALIKTGDGGGTIPDGFAIDLASKVWYLVEAELIQHSVWSHIAPQVTKQMIASQQMITKKMLDESIGSEGRLVNLAEAGCFGKAYYNIHTK